MSDFSIDEASRVVMERDRLAERLARADATLLEVTTERDRYRTALERIRDRGRHGISCHDCGLLHGAHDPDGRWRVESGTRSPPSTPPLVRTRKSRGTSTTWFTGSAEEQPRTRC